MKIDESRWGKSSLWPLPESEESEESKQYKKSLPSLAPVAPAQGITTQDLEPLDLGRIKTLKAKLVISGRIDPRFFLSVQRLVSQCYQLDPTP